MALELEYGRIPHIDPRKVMRMAAGAGATAAASAIGSLAAGASGLADTAVKAEKAYDTIARGIGGIKRKYEQITSQKDGDADTSSVKVNVGKEVSLQSHYSSKCGGLKCKLSHDSISMSTVAGGWYHGGLVLNNLSPGYADDQRIGNCVRFVGLEFDCIYAHVPIATGVHNEPVFFAIGLDKQHNNEATSSYSFLYSVSTGPFPTIGKNFEQRSRFTEFYGQKDTFNQLVAATTLSEYPYRRYSGYIPLDFVTKYNADTGTNTDIVDNALSFYFLGAITNVAAVSYNLYYLDF